MALKIKTAMPGRRGGHSDRNNAKDDMSRLREWGGGLFKQSKDYFKFARLFLITPLWLFSHPLNHFLNSGSVHCPVDRTGVPGDDEKNKKSFILRKALKTFQPQVAYMEFLKANGIEDHSFVKEMDYQEVLNSQEIFGDELAMFAKKELQKEVNSVPSVWVIDKHSKLITHVSRWLFQRPKEKSWVWW